MANYYPKGWNRFRFLITPNEFDNIFKSFHHVAFTHRVSKNYIETDPKILFDNYRVFYNKLISNYKFTMKNDELINIQTGLSNDLSKCTYGKEFIDKIDGQYYKQYDFKEPCVGTGIVVLKFDKNEKLQSNRSYIQYPEYIIGMEIQFPKEIIYFDTEKTVNCNETETYCKVYNELVGKINKLCKTMILYKLHFKTTRIIFTFATLIIQAILYGSQGKTVEKLHNRTGRKAL
jgi:hypothetical protein